MTIKLFCWNVRGLNNHRRQTAVRNWTSAYKPRIGGLLETHVAEEGAATIHNALFPGWRFDNNYSLADSGRIWILWDPILSVIIYKKSAQMVLCGVFDPVTNLYFTVGFIYASNCELERRSLWAEISLINSNPLVSSRPLLLIGDYNQILSSEEHFSATPSNLLLSGMQDLHSCLTTNNIFDMCSRGNFHTWTNNSITRKLDRAVINESWLLSFEHSFAVFDPPGSSDHSPCLVMIAAAPPLKRKTFKFFTFVIKHPTYYSNLYQAWTSTSPQGSSMFRICAKLKAAKECCRRLNSQGFSGIQIRTKEALAKLEDVQNRLLSSPTHSLMLEMIAARQNWSFFAEAEEKFFKQKSRVNWLREGDSNTRYFHRAVLQRQSRNNISTLRDSEGVSIFDPVQIETMIVSYYKELLGSINHQVTPPSVSELASLVTFRSEENLNSQLTAIPTADDITRTVFSLPNNKAPGPDGFPKEFYTSAWHIVGKDTIDAVLEFFISSSLLKQINATTIILIPKTTAADQLGNFIPISCCNFLYKIISKLLARKLQLFLHQAVQGNQSGFVKGRLIYENILLASELVANFHKPGVVTRGCFKVDLTKAFDNVNWEFILNLLAAYNLPATFQTWIKTCITSPSYSISINGDLKGYFQGKKGLRQGDSISSMLFVMAMDVLSKKLDKSAHLGAIRPHPRCYNPLITHLSFADDMLVFFDGRASSLAGILTCIDSFYAYSGLGINLLKTTLTLDGNNVSLARILAADHGVTLGSLPFKYLGVPLLTRKMGVDDFQPLLEKVQSRLSSWMVKHLSFAGRLQLLKSVIFSTINYWASVFILPKACRKELERMCKAYLWNRTIISAKGAKVSWDAVCQPKSQGGLGLRRLGKWNQVLGLKLLWMLYSSNDSLWVRWTKTHIIGARLFWQASFAGRGSWNFRRIMKLRSLGRRFMFLKPGDGHTCRFWEDNWMGRGSLLTIIGPQGPRCTGISIDSTLAQAISGSDWRLSRRRNRSASLLRATIPSQPPLRALVGPDRFSWSTDANYSPLTDPLHRFSAAKTWRSIQPHRETVSWAKLIWIKNGISKHSFISWIAIQNRLPTSDRLMSWGIPTSPNCLLCDNAGESRDHLLFGCSFSMELWRCFFYSSIITPQTNLTETLTFINNSINLKDLKLITLMLVQAILYTLWKERNSRFHNSTARTPPSLAEDINRTMRSKALGLNNIFKPNLDTLLTLWLQHYDISISRRSFVTIS